MDYHESKVWLWSGIHCGVEPTGTEIVDDQEKEPTEGVITSRFHDEAVRRGVRFLVDRECGQLFCDNTFDADPSTLNADEIAVRDFIAGEDARPPYWLALDVHDTPQAGSNALIIGETSDPTVLGAASVLDIENVVVMHNYPLFNFMPSVVSIETERSPSTNPLSQPAVWRKKLMEFVEIGPEGLLKIALDTYRNLRYYTQVDLTRVRPDGSLNLSAIALIERLERLPAPDRYFATLDVPKDIRREFNLGSASLDVGFWDDKNYSPELPELLGYRDDGRARRLCYGAFMMRIAAPHIRPPAYDIVFPQSYGTVAASSLKRYLCATSD